MARHIARRGCQDLPFAVVDTTKRLILDAFATAIGGAPCGWCRMLVEQALEWGGREFIAAVALAADLACRVGLATQSSMSTLAISAAGWSVRLVVFALAVVLRPYRLGDEGLSDRDKAI
jgi:hypothetical protein